MILAAILIIAVILRFLWIGTFTPHFDELWHLELATGRGSAHTDLPRDVLLPSVPDVTSMEGAPSWPHVWTTLDEITHPPLYFLMLRVSRDLFGNSFAVARALSALLGAAAVLVMFDVVRLLTQRTSIGLWAAVILALSSAQITIAQEVRNYTLGTLTALLVIDAVLRLETSHRAKSCIVLLIVCTFGALLSNYLAAPCLVAIGLLALFAFHGRTRNAAVGALFVGLLIFAVAWGPMMWRQRVAIAGASMPEISDASPSDDESANLVVAALKRLAILPLRQLFEPRDAALGPATGSVLVYFIPPAMLLNGLFRKRRARDSVDVGPAKTSSFDRSMLLWGLWLWLVAFVVGRVDISNGTQNLEVARHTVLAGPAVVGILAAFAASARPIFRHGVPCVIALACFLSLGLTYTRQAPQFERLARIVERGGDADAPIVFFAGPKRPYWSDVLFLSMGYYSHTYPRPIMRLTKPASPELLEQLRKWPHVWVVYAFTNFGPDELLPGSEIIPSEDASYEPFVGFAKKVRWKPSQSSTTRSSDD